LTAPKIKHFAPLSESSEMDNPENYLLTLARQLYTHSTNSRGESFSCYSSSPLFVHTDNGLKVLLQQHVKYTAPRNGTLEDIYKALPESEEQLLEMEEGYANEKNLCCVTHDCVVDYLDAHPHLLQEMNEQMIKDYYLQVG
jgi:hypothetical protein